MPKSVNFFLISVKHIEKKQHSRLSIPVIANRAAKFRKCQLSSESRENCSGKKRNKKLFAVQIGRL